MANDALTALALETILGQVLAADEAGDRELLAGVALDLVMRAGVAEAEVTRLRVALDRAIAQATSRRRQEVSPCAGR
jgi:hypothetical protein